MNGNYIHRSALMKTKTRRARKHKGNPVIRFTFLRKDVAVRRFLTLIQRSDVNLSCVEVKNISDDEVEVAFEAITDTQLTKILP